jgi:hypothetical protein
MKSIWNNTFYEAQPALGWTFDISFDSYYYGDVSTVQLEKFTQAITDISIGKRESEYTSVYYGGVEFKKFTRAQNTGTFTIKFNEDKYYTITGILEGMYNADNLNQSYFLAGSHVYNTPIAGNRIIVVNMYDPNRVHYEDDKPIATYEFYDCHIMSIDDVNYSYESTDSITRSVTFVYNYMIFTNHSVKKQRDEARAKKNRNKFVKERMQKLLGNAANDDFLTKQFATGSEIHLYELENGEKINPFEETEAAGNRATAVADMSRAKNDALRTLNKLGG